MSEDKKPYIREGNHLAPDGSPLTPRQIATPSLRRKGDPPLGAPRGPGRPKSQVDCNRQLQKLAKKYPDALMPIELLFHISNYGICQASTDLLGKQMGKYIRPSNQTKAAMELLDRTHAKLKSIEIEKTEEKSVSVSQITITDVILPDNGQPLNPATEEINKAIGEETHVNMVDFGEKDPIRLNVPGKADDS